MFNWKIIEVNSENETITQVKYFASVTDGVNMVVTEGWLPIKERTPKPDFNSIQHETVCAWAKEDSTQNGVNAIESRLQEQLDALNKNINTKAPWSPPETFKVSV